MNKACQVFVCVYHTQTMYNIKQAAARAGVTVPVLRAWERRYGIVHPERTAAGYRQFDDASVSRVRAMRALVDDGWSPSAAAASILAGGQPADVRPRHRQGVGLDPTEVDAQEDEAAALGARFIGAAQSLDPQSLDIVLDDLFSRGSFERVVSELLFPALERLGDGWAAGVISVAGEHLASNAVLRRLGLALDAAGSRAQSGPRVVVGLGPGGRHELGAMAFAVAARRAGQAVTYLGADLPIDDWVAAADGAAGALIGIVRPRDRGPAVEVARRLRATYPTLFVALGGRAAQRTIGFPVLPDDLPAAVRTVAEAIGDRPAPASHPA